MKAKLVSLLVLSGLVFSSLAFADDATKLSPRLEARLQFLDEKLNLTPEQEQQIVAIWQRAEEKLAAAEGSARPRKQRKELRKAIGATRAEVRAVLTPEQQTIFDELKPARRNKP